MTVHNVQSDSSKNLPDDCFHRLGPLRVNENHCIDKNTMSVYVQLSSTIDFFHHCLLDCSRTNGLFSHVGITN